MSMQRRMREWQISIVNMSIMRIIRTWKAWWETVLEIARARSTDPLAQRTT